MKNSFKLVLLVLILTRINVYAQSKSIETTITGVGTPILFLPGFASDATIWDSTIAKFSKTNTCHTIDYAGFGKVEPIETPWLPTILEELKIYVKNLDNSNLIIVGHSMGGTIATWLAAQSDLKINQIVIIDGLPATGALMMPDFSPDKLLYDSPYNQQILKMDDSSFEKMADGMSQGMATAPENQVQIKESILKTDRLTYVYGFTDYLKMDIRQLLQNISVPVTILAAGLPYGKEVVTQTYNSQYAHLKNYNLIMNETSRHFIMMDAPVWLNKKLDLILAK